ncbi:fimbrillin family protein [Dysgonomonas sp. GY75]|nr:fimbrillin family protein [Dysgonomonas sp. GY75]
MKKNIFLIMAAASVVAALPGCTDTDGYPVQEQNTALSVADIGFGSKAADGANGTSKAYFEPGDMIMLYLPGSGGDPYRKVTLTPSGWVLDSPVTLSENDTGIYACYPAVSAGDELLIEHITGMDYLYSGKHTANRMNPSIFLAMRHALALIEFEFEPGPLITGSPVDFISIEGEGLHSRAAISLLSGKPAYEENIHEPAIIYGRQMENPFIGYDTKISLMVVPVMQVKSDGDIFFNFCFGEFKYHWPVPAGTAWESAKRYTYRVQLRERLLEVTDVQVQDWTDGGKETVTLPWHQ